MVVEPTSQVKTSMKTVTFNRLAMKNLAKYLVPVAAAAIALVSCNKEGDITSAPENTVRLTFVAQPEALKGEEPELKSYIDANNTILWGTGEVMIGCITAGEINSFAPSDEVDASGQTSAAFSFTFTGLGDGPYLYQGLYPASAAATSNNTKPANYKVNLPAIQNATATSYDPAAYIMVARPESKTVIENWTASYRRGTALNKITLKNFASSVTINKVKITAEGKKLAGGRHFNLSTGEGLEVYGTDNAIEVLYATPLSGTSMDVWFTSWGAEIAEGEKLTVVAYTTDNKSYTKEITVPAGQSIKFQEGYLNNTGIGMSGISPEDVTSLDGNYVILAQNSGNYYALKGEASGTRIASVDYSGDTSSYAGDASIIWTIATSGSGYTIKNGSNYIGWTSGNSADLVDENSYDATKCLMGIDDNGDGTYKIYVAADATRILARNQSNAYFAFYTGSGYNALTLVPATAMEQVAAPTFNPAAGEVASGTNVSISCATSGATIHYTVDGTDPTSSSATYSSPIEITATTTIKAIAVKSGMADSEIATATYSVASAGSVTLTESDITAGDNTVKGTNSNALAYRLGTSSNNGSLTFPAGYSTITFTLAGWASGTRSFTITNGKISGSASLSPAAGSPSGTINAGFSTSYTGTEYTIVVDDPTQEVVFSGRRCVVWGFTAVSAGPAVTWNLNSIEITTPPTKTVYTAGQSFDPAGMVVTGHFVDADDNTNTKDEEVTGYTISPDGALAETDDHVTITYQGKTTTQAITVNAVSATTIADVLAGGAGTYEVPDVLVYAVKGSGLIIGDATGKMYAYKSSHGLSVGDVRTVSGSTTVYNDVYEFSNPTFSGSGTATVNHGTAVELDSQASALQSAFANPSTAVYVHAIGSQSSRNITTTGGTALYLSANETATDGKNVEVYGYVYAYSTSHSNFDILVTSIEEYVDVNTPTVSVDPTSLNWTASEYGSANAKTIEVTLNGAASAGDYTISGSNSAWTVSKNGNTITVYPNAENSSTTDAKSITLTIAHADDPTVYQEVTCTQAKASSGSTKRFTLTISTSEFNSTSYAANNGSHSVTATATDSSTMNVDVTSNQIMLQSSAMQWQKNNGYLYNTTDLGSIVSVTVNSSAGSFTTYYGTSANPSSSTSVGSGNGFFKVSVGSATGKTSSVVVVFDK